MDRSIVQSPAPRGKRALLAGLGPTGRLAKTAAPKMPALYNLKFLAPVVRLRQPARS
jgi:hypothetical protein